MYIPEALTKENKFVDVAIPTNKMLFSRIGEVQADQRLYSGEDEVPLNLSKSDQLDDFDKYAEAMAKEEMSKHSKSE